MKLDRYRRNPVVLDTHDRYSAGAVIGKAAVKVVDRQLEATITFAETPRAEEAWQLVRGGFLRALSVGFMPGETQRISEGETAKLGEQQVQGPAIIRKTSELYEISVVPVPADADALRRGLRWPVDGTLDEAFAAFVGRTGAIQMADTKPKADETKPAESTTPAPKPAAEETRAVAPVPTDVELIARNIRAITPKGLESVADRCIVEGKSLDESRKALLDEFTKRSAPAGTPEPPKTEGKNEERSGEMKVADVADDVFMRSL
jgi:HK97 family phage prohead protease